MMLILPKLLGLNGVWFAQPIADVISFTVTTILLVKEVKSHKVETNDEVEVNDEIEAEIISLDL